MNLTQFLATNSVYASGFEAIQGLSAHSTGTVPALLSSLAAPLLQAQGIEEYYALELPRGTKFNTTEDIMEVADDLRVRKYAISVPGDYTALPVVIISQHAGTVAILQARYPDAPVLATASPADIAGKHVVGSLPPHLVTVAAAFTAATIKGFDYKVDGDLSGQELKDRLIIADEPLALTELSI